MKRSALSKACLLLFAGLSAAGSAVGAPEEEQYGKSRGYPIAPRMTPLVDQRYFVGSMTAMDQLYKAAPVERVGEVRPLPLSQIPPPIMFSANNQQHGISSLLNDTPVTGLLLMKDGQIITERYQYDRTPQHRFTSFSMAKTVTGILVGAALKDGYIKSLDDTADQYVKELQGYDYGKVTIRNLLRMTSGIKWQERGVARSAELIDLVVETVYQRGRGGVGAIRGHKFGTVEQGTVFNYNSADTFVLGLVVRAATGKSLADYASEKIWSKIGAEADASWNIDWSGVETAYSYFNATLRDWGRLAQFMNEGLPGVVDEAYYDEMTSGAIQPGHLYPRTISSYFGYGYQTWILPYRTRTFAMLGSYGQMIIMQPKNKIVIVLARANKTMSVSAEQGRYDLGMIHGFIRSLGGDLEMYPMPKN